jgi:MFS family permease
MSESVFRNSSETSQRIRAKDSGPRAPEPQGNRSEEQELIDDKTANPKRKVLLAVGGACLLVMIPVTLIVPPLKELIGDRFSAAPFWTHSFMSCNLLGAALASPLIAMLCDRAASRRRVVVVALLGDAALLAYMAVAPSLAMILLARTFEGVTHILALTALMAMAADHAPPERRGRAMGLIGASMMFGTAIGTRLGGIVWRLWPGWTFMAAAAAAVVAALFVILAVREAAQRLPIGRLSSSLRVVRTHPGLLVAYAYAFVDRFCVGVIISSFVLFLADAHDVSPDGRARLLAMFLIPFATLVYPAGRAVDRIGAVGPLVIGSAGFGVMFGLYGFVPSEWLSFMMVGSGVLSALMFAPTLWLCAELSPGNLRGAAYAGFNAAGSLGFLCGPIIGGLLSQFIGAEAGAREGYQAAFLLAGATEVAIALMTLPWLLRLRRRSR